MRRISVTMESGFEQEIAGKMFDLGAVLAWSCRAKQCGARTADLTRWARGPGRLEILALLDSSTAMIQTLRRDVVAPGNGIVCSEIVEVLQSELALGLEPPGLRRLAQRHPPRCPRDRLNAPY